MADVQNSFTPVNKPGQFDAPAGSGPPDPDNPGNSKPGREHEEEPTPQQLRRLAKKARRELGRLKQQTANASVITMKNPVHISSESDEKDKNEPKHKQPARPRRS